MFDGVYGMHIQELGTAFSRNPVYREYWNSLSDEIREEVNTHASEFHSEEEIMAYIQKLKMKA